MIEIHNVSLQIQKTNILQDINVMFEDGQIHGIVGRNGSRKTWGLSLRHRVLSRTTADIKT